MGTDNTFSWGWVIFIVLILWFFVGNGFGGYVRNNNGCQGTSGCEVERREIIDSATTQYLIQEKANETQNYLGTKIDFYGYENLKDQLNQARDEITFLKTNANTDAKFNELSRQLEACCCNMNSRFQALDYTVAKIPPFYTCGNFVNSCGC